MGRPRRRWEENIRMDLEEIGINAGNWVTTVLAESSNDCRHEPGRCHSLSFILIYFLSLYLSRFSFYNNAYAKLL
jgi:hypothetical protein